MKKRNYIVPALFLLLLCGIFPFDLAVVYTHGLPPARRVDRELPPPVFTLSQFTSGRYLQDWSTLITNASWFANGIVIAYNEVMFRLLGRIANPNFVEGKENWFFIKRKIQVHDDAYYDEIIETYVPKFAQVARNIEQTGSHLLVTIIPDRDRVYPEVIYDNGVLPAPKQRFRDHFVQQLESEGVDVLFMDEDFRAARDGNELLFFRAEHHWSFQGAREAARSIGRHVAKFDSLQKSLAPIRYNEKPYTETWFMGSHVGNNIKKMGFLPNSNLERSFAEDLPVAKFSPTASGLSQRDDLPTCAGLLTTSMGDYGTKRFIENELQCKMVEVRVQGMGPLATVSLYISKFLNLLDRGYRKPPLIIWEIPELNLYGSYSARDTMDWFVNTIPAYRPNDGYKTIPFTLENPRGMTLEQAGKRLKTRQPDSYVDVVLDRPVSSLRLVMTGESFQAYPDSGVFVTCRPDQYYFPMSRLGRGFVSFDFDCEGERRVFHLVFKGLMPDKRIGIAAAMSQ